MCSQPTALPSWPFPLEAPLPFLQTSYSLSLAVDLYVAILTASSHVTETLCIYTGAKARWIASRCLLAYP